MNLIPYDGTPEIKERDGGKYLYVRKRVGSRLTSTYVDIYSDELYVLLLRHAREARELRKQIRRVERELAALGYEEVELSARVMLNLDFARANMKANIYDQAVLEGVATTFPQTEDIIENSIVSGMKPTDVQKILNLKHAWEFILDKDVLSYPTGYDILCHIAKLVNEGFYTNGGRIRGVPVTIGGTSNIPPLPIESIVKEQIDAIISMGADAVDTAIALCMYCMKTQIFNDGNKRASVIFANHYLISQGQGLIVIPESHVPEFKRLLVAYYEDRDGGELKAFMRSHCGRCGAVLVKQETITATGHKWGQWVETIKPSANADGINTRMCTVCKATEEQNVDNNIFTDVKADRFEAAILWAYYNGITTGTGDGSTFSPENACTRKQIVTFLFRNLTVDSKTGQ